jgi:hypothetical protein
MDKINEHKTKYLRHIASLESMSQSWIVWEHEIRAKLSSNPTGSEILNLGDSLSDIFQANATSGREQGSLSGGGAAWECLNSWYLNLVCWNTPVMIIKQKKTFVPPIINDSLSVTISNNQTNTESDIVMFSIPLSDTEVLQNSKLSTINDHLTRKFGEVVLVNLQCKTNWNDNSQVPMLWDMIYNSDSRLPNISVGINGVSPKSVGSFKYAYVTVPTNKLTSYKPSSIPVLRVKNLTGGNYWGHASKPNIASSIKELPNRGFSKFFSGGICAHIDATIKNDPDYLDKFLTLSW